MGELTIRVRVYYVKHLRKGGSTDLGVMGCSTKLYSLSVRPVGDRPVARRLTSAYEPWIPTSACQGHGHGPGQTVSGGWSIQNRPVRYKGYLHKLWKSWRMHCLVLEDEDENRVNRLLMLGSPVCRTYNCATACTAKDDMVEQ